MMNCKCNNRSYLYKSLWIIAKIVQRVIPLNFVCPSVTWTVTPYGYFPMENVDFSKRCFCLFPWNYHVILSVSSFCDTSFNLFAFYFLHMDLTENAESPPPHFVVLEINLVFVFIWVKSGHSGTHYTLFLAKTSQNALNGSKIL